MVLMWVTAVSSATTIASNFSSWWFVWRHERSSVEMGERGFREQAFWFSFSYLLPFLPLAFLGIQSVTGRGMGLFVAILSTLMAIMMTGLTISTINWIRKSGDKVRNKGRWQESPGELLDTEGHLHLRWTTALSGLAALFWWGLVGLHILL